MLSNDIRRWSMVCLFVVPVPAIGGNVPADSSIAALTPDIARGATWRFGRNFIDSFVGKTTLVHAVSVGATWGLMASDVDARVQRWSAHRPEGWSVGLSLPALGLGYFAPAVVPLILRYRGEDVRTRNAGSAALQAVAIAWVSGNLVKAITGRRDPRYFEPDLAEERSRDWVFGFWRRGIYNGWPSGHTITNMAMAAALSSYYSDSAKVRAWAYGWAACVMASATFGYQGDIHWVSDVVAGGAMGWAIGRTVGKAFARHESKVSRTRVTLVPAYGGIRMALRVDLGRRATSGQPW